MKSSILFVLFLFPWSLLISQVSQDSLILSAEGQFEYSSTFFCYHSAFDRNDAPYIYSASTVLGLVTFDISDLTNPIPIDTIPPVAFNGHDVSGLHQEGDRLYVALGGIQSIFTRRPALAIVDISDPGMARIEGIWDTTAFDNGCAIVRVQDNYAYLGIMDGGVLILDISHADSIRSVGHILPDPNFPSDIPYAPKARGLEVRDSLLFVAYDPGGIRVIDVSDKRNPIEIGMYMHTGLDSIAQPAYNNIRLSGNYAFATVDYCGLDIIDISDPTDMKSVYWYNPWNCNGGSWFGSPGHSNELILTNHDSLLFMSGGDIELVVLDVSDPTDPVFLAEYGAVEDSAVAWGLDVWRDKIVLSLVDNSFLWTPVIQPYYGDQGGIRTLSWEKKTSTLSVEAHEKPSIQVFPNPANTVLTLQLQNISPTRGMLEIWGMDGKKYKQLEIGEWGENTPVHISLESLGPGLYVLCFRQAQNSVHTIFIKE